MFLTFGPSRSPTKQKGPQRLCAVKPLAIVNAGLVKLKPKMVLKL